MEKQIRKILKGYQAPFFLSDLDVFQKIAWRLNYKYLVDGNNNHESLDAMLDIAVPCICTTITEDEFQHYLEFATHFDTKRLNGKYFAIKQQIHTENLKRIIAEAV
jgi:hypothetical protein